MPRKSTNKDAVFPVHLAAADSIDALLTEFFSRDLVFPANVRASKSLFLRGKLSEKGKRAVLAQCTNWFVDVTERLVEK